MERYIICIDGLAGTGKSTVSKILAKRLGFAYLSSGLIYRALGYAITKSETDPSNAAGVVAALEELKIAVVNDKEFNCLLSLNNTVLSAAEVFTPAVSEATSIASVHPVVRQKLLRMQRQAFAGQNLIAEGRDMGTIVFPQANLKFFIEVAPEISAQRRLEQLCDGQSHSPAKIAELKQQLNIEISERNDRDQNRAESPTVPATDALIIDNGAKTLTETVDVVYSRICKLTGNGIS